jgi:glycosyltransferase involved in cell wall biosynthesis
MITLTGTDLYRDFAPTRSRHPALAVRALDQSNRIILLQPLMAQRLKLQWKKKSSLVMMDVPKSKQPPRTKASVPLRVCVIGHMRHEKDSLRTAMAVRDIPTGIVEVTHAGKALSELLQQRAKRESTKNANWSWLGSVTHEKVQQLMKSSDVLVNSSRIEGAPNVLFEAIRWRLPVIASRIDGHVGVLGNRYKGFFQTGVTQDLHRLLLRCSQHSKFYGELGKSIDRLATKYRQGSEFKSLTSAISKL